MKTIKITIVLLFITLTLLLLSSAELFAQKREFRGSWVSSVSNLDWPSSRNLTVAEQKAELISILDELQTLNMNAVLLQVRPEADALYNSSLEPWSYWLTGTQGTAPSPLYDPLQYAIEEAHKRGIELHAWLNPFRAEANIGSYTLHSSHVVNQHPTWILTFNSIGLKLLDPGKATVRNYVQSVVMDIVNNYDVDGIIFDDYFYPYPNSGAGFSGISNEDASTYANEGRGIGNVKDWRRDNVNLLISNVNTAIKAAKPYVKFGISPFGIWKNGTPAGIIGMDAYSEIYCDATAWLTAETIDYLSPQLYWQFGGNQDYGKLLPWWGTQINGKHLYSSIALYKSSSWAANELTNQIDLNRSNANCDGSVYFRHSYFANNPHGIKNTLQTSYYQNKALAPTMGWLGGSSPNAPTNLQVIAVSSENNLSWIASTSSNLKFNVIYRSLTSPVDITDENNIVNIIDAAVTSYTDQTSTNYYYAITTVNKYDLESGKSNEELPGTLLTLDNFESSVGHFDKDPNFSGSTRGIDGTSTSSRNTLEGYNSTASLQVELVDNATSTDDWWVRLLSGTGSPANNISINSQHNIGYWIKTNSANASAQISILIDDSDGIEKGTMQNIFNDNQWHLYQWNLSDNAQWSAFTGNGTIEAASITIDALLFTAPNGSANWTILIDDVIAGDSPPVPVELINFEATFVNNTINLFWETATEINNYGFEIQRTVGQKSFLSPWETVGFVEGAGNSNSPKQYSFVDTDNLSGKVSYRLKQVDIDGATEYSNVVTVTINGLAKTELYQNYPNPFNPTTIISFNLSHTTHVKITVYNTLGEKVTELVNEVREAGIHNLKFDASNLTSGFYIYRIVTDSYGETPSYSKTMKMLLIK